MSMKKKRYNELNTKILNRREAISKLAAVSAGLGVAVVAAGVAGYLAGTQMAPTKPVERTVTIERTIEHTVTKTETLATTVATPPATRTLSTADIIALGYKNYEPATKPLAEPKDWTSPPPEYKNKKEIVIGTSMPLTGIFSWAATWRKLREAWVEKVNSEGGLLGLPVRMICYDDGSDASRAIANFTKLITIDKVDLLLSGCPTATMVPVMNAMDKYRYKPVILSGSSDYESFLTANMGKGWETAFEIQIPAEFFNYSTWVWIDAIPADIKPKKVGIIYGTYSPFTIHGSAGAKYFAEERGMEIAYFQGYPEGTTDFTPMVSAARSAGVEVLLSVDTDLAPTKLILEACRAMDWQPKIFWSIEVLYPGFEDPTRPGRLQPLVYYTTTAAMHWPTWPDPPYKDAAFWVEQYKKIFNIAYPNFDAGWAPLECQILEQAVQSSGSLEFDVLSKYLMTHSFNTLMGRIEFTDEKIIRGFTMGTTIIDEEGREQVIVPENLATADWRKYYPRPPWKEYYP